MADNAPCVSVQRTDRLASSATNQRRRRSPGTPRPPPRPPQPKVIGRYTCYKSCDISAKFDSESEADAGGTLAVGEDIEVYETRVNKAGTIRVQFDRGELTHTSSQRLSPSRELLAQLLGTPKVAVHLHPMRLMLRVRCGDIIMMN